MAIAFDSLKRATYNTTLNKRVFHAFVSSPFDKRLEYRMAFVEEIAVFWEVTPCVLVHKVDTNVRLL